MNLTARIFRVKQHSAAQLFAACLLTGASLSLVWWGTRNDDAHLNHFGTTLATSLASQATEPFVGGDLIHLGVLANRIIELPEVIGATVYTVDGEILALSGDVQRGRPFTREIVQDAAVVGLVRLHVDETTFGAAIPGPRVIGSILAVLLIPVLFGLLAGINPPSIRRRMARPARVAVAVPGGDERHGEPAEAGLEPRFLLAVNLFNQLSLQPDQCARELDFARTLVATVAERYRGEMTDLPGTGLLLSFDSQGSERIFEVICAGFVLSQLLRDAETWGHYRISGHAAWLESEAHLAADSEALADVAILSALAKEGCIAISHTLYELLTRKDRFHSTPLTNPLLEDLGSIDGGAQLVHSLAPTYQSLVAKQVAQLAASTASASTF